MPIFKFVAVTGVALLGLLFAADAMLTPSGPLFTNDTEGLTRAEPKQKQAKRSEPAEAREAPRPRAPSLLQVDAGKAEPAQDETVRYELPQPVLAAPVQAPAQAPAPTVIAAPAPVAAPAPTPALAPLPTAIEPTALVPVTPVDPAASAAMAEAEGKTGAAKIGAKVEPAKNQAVKAEAQRIKTTKVEAAKADPDKTDAAKLETVAPAPQAPQQQAERPRALAPVQAMPPQPAVAVPAAAPSPAVIETKPAPAPVATAKVETGGTEATGRANKREAAATETRQAAPTQKARKPVVRNHDRDSRYAAYRSEGARDHVPTVENGYAYGVRPGSERREWQRPWDGDFSQHRFRF